MNDESAGGMEFLKWLRAIGRERATGYRWAALGWIVPVNVAGKLYLTTEEIARFWARAKAGEFAQVPRGVCAGGGEGNKD